MYMYIYMYIYIYTIHIESGKHIHRSVRVSCWNMFYESSASGSRTPRAARLGSWPTPKIAADGWSLEAQVPEVQASP